MAKQNTYKAREGRNPFEEYKVIKGVKFHPISMAHYQEWLFAKPALTLRLSTLPAAYAVQSYLSAIYSMEYDAIATKGKPIGILSRFALLVCLSMRLDMQTIEDVIRFSVDETDEGKLKALLIYTPELTEVRLMCEQDGVLVLPKKAVSTDEGKPPVCEIEGCEEPLPVEGEGQIVPFGDARIGEVYSARYMCFGDEPTVFRPIEATAIRKAIAELNGEKLPDESENPELIDALSVKASAASSALEYSTLSLLDGVAYASGLRAKDLLGWTVREFEQRRRTIERSRQHLINGIAEGSGAEWKGGNPVPHLFFDKRTSEADNFTPVGEVLHNLGSSESWLDSQTT